MKIHFSYQAPMGSKHEVGISSDFTNWKIIPMKDVGGVYKIEFDLCNGTYQYKYIVDGVWIADPSNPIKVDDPFGGYNSVIHVTKSVHQIEWEYLPSRLEKFGIEECYEINRCETDSIEFRLIWFPKLADKIRLFANDQWIVLRRLGTHNNRDVYHAFFTVYDSCRVIIEVEYRGNILIINKNGFHILDEVSQRLYHDTSSIDGILIEINKLDLFKIPSWVQEGVIYQIFTDRFYNGDKSNDQDFSEWYYQDSKMPPEEGTILAKNHEYYHFVDDWYSIDELKQSRYMEEGKPDWWTFYGGDIAGVIAKLSYLSDLGVTILYFNPLWEAKSNHKYDAVDYKKIDNHFGSEDEMIRLVQLAHSCGIRIILDVAFNHTGETFWAFRDCIEKGATSEFWNWYDWVKWPLPNPLPEDFQPKEYYQCWWGIKDMPDLNYDLSRTHPTENEIKNLNDAVPNNALIEYILDCVSWWLLEIGIDGFRLDVPDEVPWWFWQMFRKHVKDINPNAWLVGEIWSDATPWVSQFYFDSVMNYAYFKNPVLEFFVLKLIEKDSFMRIIEEGLAKYQGNAIHSMMNLLGSHDTVRILELAKGDINKVKHAVFFQMTFIGAPHVYYGDEIGMLGGNDPDNRRPFNWKWEEDETAIDILSYYKSLIRTRKDNPLLRNGEFSFIGSKDMILSYKRFNESQCLVCCINLSNDGVEKATACKPNVIFDHPSVNIKEASILIPANGVCVYASTSPV